MIKRENSRKEKSKLQIFNLHGDEMKGAEGYTDYRMWENIGKMEKEKYGEREETYGR